MLKSASRRLELEKRLWADSRSDYEGNDRLPAAWVILEILFVVLVLSERPDGHLRQTDDGKQQS